jgi:hypothetical protein
MDFLFDRRFFYNWTVNPDKPGLADFFVFFLKLSFIGVMTLFVLGDFRYVEALGFLLSPFIEEQTRVYWMKNAKAQIRAGLMFAFFISLFEFISYGRVSQGFFSGPALIDTAAIRVVPTILHFFCTILGYRLLRRGISAVRVWMACVAVHLFFNEVLATRIGDWIGTLQLGSRFF